MATLQNKLQVYDDMTNHDQPHNQPYSNVYFEQSPQGLLPIL